MRKMAVLAFVPALLASRCFSPGGELRLAPETRPYQPVFYAQWDTFRVNSLGWLRVDACRPDQLPRTVWRIERAPVGDTPRPLSIAYGQAPSGYRETHPAEPLAAGRCYNVFAESPGTYEMDIHLGPDGAVLPGRGKGGDVVRQMERAGIRCARRYRRAGGTGAEVDADVHVVADTTVTCGDIRARWPTVLKSQTSERRWLEAAGYLAATAALIWISDKLPDPEDPD